VLIQTNDLRQTYFSLIPEHSVLPPFVVEAVEEEEEEEVPLFSSIFVTTTVQAPHPPSPQPNFDPVNFMSSRKNDNNV